MKIKENPYYGNPGVSNSSMSLINPDQGGSPKLYQSVLHGSMEKNTNLSLENGKLVHLFALQPDEFTVADVEKPSAGLQKIIDELILRGDPLLGFCDTELVKAARRAGYNPKWGDDAILKNVKSDELKAYYDYLKLPHEFVIINSKEKSIIENSIRNLKIHPLSKYLLFGDEWDGLESYSEYEINAIDPITGLKVKGLIDRIAINHDKKVIYIPDLKTTSKATYSFPNSYRWFRYYRQHTFYMDLVSLHFNDLITKGYTIIPKSVVVNISNGLFEVAVYDIDPNYIEFGREEYKNLLHRISFHEHHGWEYSMEEYLSIEEKGVPEMIIQFDPNLK